MDHRVQYLLSFRYLPKIPLVLQGFGKYGHHLLGVFYRNSWIVWSTQKLHEERGTLERLGQENYLGQHRSSVASTKKTYQKASRQERKGQKRLIKFKTSRMVRYSSFHSSLFSFRKLWSRDQSLFQRRTRGQAKKCGDVVLWWRWADDWRKKCRCECFG